MKKDLTTSKIDRQNILNNEIALLEIQKKGSFNAVFWDGKLMFTKDMVASFFGVEPRTIDRYLNDYSEELRSNGYEVLRGKRLKDFLSTMSGNDINVVTKINILGVFDFRSFLNIAMLLAESDKAKLLRQMMLDIVIDLINQKTGGSTKYINQRDKDYISASLQEDNYRRQFTDALKIYVEDDRFKYAYFTDMIYVSIFKEKAKEYKKILDLKASDKVRDTFYSEILDIISAFECGLADAIRVEYEKVHRPLTKSEVVELIKNFEKLALWKPLISRGRIKMASRDLALRDAFHYQLSEYIQPLNEEEYKRFLGEAGDELERLMEENRSVLKRLKERD
ncbi:MAG: DNA-binding protein [Syntrophomonadaceae bacterium]